MSDSPALMFLQCVIVPFVLPSFVAGFWIGKRFQAFGFPGMFIPDRWRK